MICNQEEDEFVAVRVQDPRLQNEGSWNSFVDYKIFLHTNSKAFTAKTSCVRRRYSEFVWLKKKLQKNSGLVPVPELPGKYFFFFSNEDFLERRRKGLQAFLDNVVNTTVCLSDSQLHLFLQTQLPVGHILDCVQGHTPYSVTDAILTYASSNRGYAQAQEEDADAAANKEPSLSVSYESMESPAPHQPCLQPKELFSPELVACDRDSVELQQKETTPLEVVLRDLGPAEATFFLGDGRERLPQTSFQIQTSVEVHSPTGAGSGRAESAAALDGAGETEPHPEDRRESSGEAKPSEVESEPKSRANSADILHFEDAERGERGAGSGEEGVPSAICSGRRVSESSVSSEAEGRPDAEVRPEEASNDSDGGGRAEATPRSGIHAPAPDAPEVRSGGEDDDVPGAEPADVDVDGHSSSNGSIVQVSDGESFGEDSIPSANVSTETPPADAGRWSPAEDSGTNSGDVSAQEDVGDSAKSLDPDLIRPVEL
ncbi:sorting nexin-11 [Pungitius pungitius]|uniref:sorting nexin-11 n=1 Tax=Pungitius pungitius TaxID=134920 RepID=UPI002E155755